MPSSKTYSLMAVPASALLFIYTSLAEPQIQIQDYPTQTVLQDEGSSSVVRISYSAIEIIDKIQTLKKVVSELIDNSVELEHEIIEMVDRNFWELI